MANRITGKLAGVLVRADVVDVPEYKRLFFSDRQLNIFYLTITNSRQSVVYLGDIRSAFGCHDLSKPVAATESIFGKRLLILSIAVINGLFSVGRPLS